MGNSYQDGSGSGRGRILLSMRTPPSTVAITSLTCRVSPVVASVHLPPTNIWALLTAVTTAPSWDSRPPERLRTVAAPDAAASFKGPRATNSLRCSRVLLYGSSVTQTAISRIDHMLCGVHGTENRHQPRNSIRGTEHLHKANPVISATFSRGLRGRLHSIPQFVARGSSLAACLAIDRLEPRPGERLAAHPAADDLQLVARRAPSRPDGPPGGGE